MKKKFSLFLLIFCPLMIALFIYKCYRVDDVFINKIILFFHLDIGPHINWNPPYWFVYSLPGALWLFSFNMIMMLWPSGSSRLETNLWLLTTLLFALGLEILQKLNLTDGVFDYIDVWSYFIVFIISLLIFYFRNKNFNHSMFFIFNPSQLFKKFIFSFYLLIVVFADVL